ncbi:D-arabinono-1,4-lactone oxidase [Kytococcus sedentarius]|uniref:D-arabinono-1,4-lactone oxidase n=1 Tax=Kytococcus sedentarius TaxID=1276 RepID=UPI0035BC5BDE
MSSGRSTGFATWSGTVRVPDAPCLTPDDLPGVVDAVRRAAAAGRRLHPAGSGHSFTGVAAPRAGGDSPGASLRLDRLTGVVDDSRADQGLLTLGAGTPLHALPELLAPYGLALENMGDIDRQTLAGALSTGTHGTGAAFGCLATQVRGATLVDGTGEVHRIGPEDPRLGAVAVGLGVLGVLVDVTLQLVPAFSLDLRVDSAPVGELFDDWAEHTAAHDHFEAFWFPHHPRAITKATARRPADTTPVPRSWSGRTLTDGLLSNAGLAALARAADLLPGQAPWLNRTLGGLEPHRVVGPSHAVFVSSRTVRFREMEYGVPLADLPEVMREVQRALRRRRWPIGFPLEIRSVAGDDLWLSMAHGGPRAFIAVHTVHDHGRARGYFAELERILRAADGRPHWGKMHSLNAPELAARYPRMTDFQALRGQLDPARVLGNEYTDRVLGLTAPRG